MSEWLIQEEGDELDILCNRRIFKRGLEDLHEAIRAIKRSRKWSSSDTLIYVEFDGYRRKMRISET